MATVILSPHLDDAVFSCWHVLSEPDTTVITIFAGIPAKGTKTIWDRLCGKADSAAMMQGRLRENTAIFKDVGVTFRNLEFLDGQYKAPERSVPDIARAVLAHVDSDATFYAPLAGSALWRHPDHVTIRELGKYLLQQGRKVSFYADIPYMQMPSSPSSNFTQRISARASKLIGVGLTAEVTELDAPAQIRKRNAMRQYGSQYNMINLVSLGMFGRDVNVQREVSLQVAA